MFSKKYLKLYLIAITILIGISILAIAFMPTIVLAQENNNTSISTNWGQLNAKIYEAQQITQGSNTVIVGVIDTGICKDHNDIKDELCMENNSHCYFNPDTNAFLDTFGHGTNVAGIIASQTNGIAPNVKLVSLRAAYDHKIYPVFATEAIKYATTTLNDTNTENDISIINLSAGGDMSSYNELTVYDLKVAIKNYCNKGGLLIVAAGNEGMNIDGSMYYPAAYNPSAEYPTNLDNIITVGAINEDNTIVDFGDWSNSTKASNFGVTSVDLFAPGTDIYTTNKNGGYEYVSGTSFATPFVTGVAALLKSIDPTLTGTKIKEIILNSVDELDGFDELCVTGGKLNALKAVNSIAYNYDESTATITGLNFVPNGELTLPTTLRINNYDEVVENIGYNVFQNCTELTKITIPSSVKTIASYAFANCTKLSNLTFEEDSQLTYIGSNAFESCTSLEAITLPIGLEQIYQNTFAGCTKLKTITIPANVGFIGNYAFQRCTELEEVIFANGAILDYIGVRAFQNCYSLTDITIPDGVTTIDNYAFQMSGLTMVGLSKESALSIIGTGAFNQTGITYMVIPAGVTTIGMDAFSSCTSLTTVYYGGESETDWNSISIGTNNTKLVSAKRYYLKESQPTEYGFFWRYVSNAPQAWPFYGIKYTLIDNKEYEVSKGGEIVGTLQIPSTYNGLPVGRIAKWGFANSLNITKIIIPASITVLYGSSFSNCPNVESISVDTNNTVYMSQGNCIISRKNVELIVGCKNSEILAGITKICDNAFNGCSTLTSITIPNSVKYIGFSAFENCTGLTSINIPSSVTDIDVYAFYGCSSLANITIPAGVETIGSHAFYGTGLTSISIPSSVESIGEEAFGGNYLTEINVQLGNSNYYSEEGVLFGNGGVLMVYPKGKEGVYVVPDGTTEIGNYAFCGCYQLKGITIPSSVTKINDYAFVGCDQLEEFIFAEGSTLEYIGYEAFAGCWALEEITIPSSVTYVGALAFATWEEHQKIVVQADVSVLEQWDVDWAVDCYAEIEWDGYNLVATEGLGYILTDNGYEVEVGSSLEHSNGVVIIPAEYEGYPVIGVADNGFAGRSELIKVIFAGNNLIRIGTNAFGGCHNLIAINIPNGVTEIGDNAFYACHQLQNVRLPRTVERIGDSVFAECNNLKSVTVPGGVVYVEASALEGTVGYTIYTEIGSNPSEWYFLNNNPECAIFYNCMLSEDGTYVVFIVIQEENYINADPSAPYRDGYVLLGWTTVYGGDVEYTMQEVSDGAIDYGTVLYAVWQREV